MKMGSAEAQPKVGSSARSWLLMLLGNLRRVFRAGPVPTAERKSPMRLRKLVAAAVPLPALLGLAVAVPAAAATEPLVTLADNAAPLVNSARTGEVAGGQRITAALSLKLHNQQALEKFLADVQNPASPQYHHFLTPAQFNAEFGPTQTDVDKAVSFLG